MGIETGRTTRLSEVLFSKRRQSFSSLAPIPSNVHAVEASLLFSARLRDFVVLHGPSGWGKTHLLEAAAARLTNELGEKIEVHNALDFVTPGQRPDPTHPLLLDDLQDLINKPKQRLALRVALERRVRSGRATMVACSEASNIRAIRGLVPFPRTWRFANVADPTPAERLSVLAQLAGAEELSLNPDFIRVMANEMHGNGRTLEGALKRLKLDSSQWTDKVSMLRGFGLLDPYFADNPEWDLRLQITRAVEELNPRVIGLDPTDLSLYVMLKVACLSEDGTAQFLQMEPGVVYQRTGSIERRLHDGEVNPAVIDRITEHVVGKICHDPL